MRWKLLIENPCHRYCRRGVFAAELLRVMVAFLIASGHLCQHE
jgi:hypothetical protein